MKVYGLQKSAKAFRESPIADESCTTYPEIHSMCIRQYEGQPSGAWEPMRVYRMREFLHNLPKQGPLDESVPSNLHFGQLLLPLLLALASSNRYVYSAFTYSTILIHPERCHK